MVVAAWAGEAGRIDPVVRVFDRNLAPVAFELLKNDSNSYALQIRDALPDTDYLIRVEAAPSATNTNLGNYVLAVDYRTAPILLDTFAAGTLSDEIGRASCRDRGV